MSLSKANAAYIRSLNRYPLVTKSVTAGILNGLNETIASAISGDFESFRLSPKSKVVTMVLYGSLILTPVSHNLYSLLNRVYGGRKAVLMKVLQILTSLATITPTLSAIFTSWISIINNYKPSKFSHNTSMSKYLYSELFKLYATIKNGLSQNYLRILKGSMMTSLVSLVLAQNFLAPELWVVFFNSVYFVLGTFQNTKIKLAAKREKAKTDRNAD